MRADAARFSPALFAVLLGALWLVNRPGRVNLDSLEQLVGAAYPAFRTDWHSPIVGWLWQLPAPLLGQPSGALAVQALLLAFAMAVVPAGRPRGVRSWAALAIEAAWRGALVGLGGAISKDVLLIALLLAALAAFRLRWSGGGRAWAGLGAGLLVLATAVRSPNVVMFAVAAALALPFFVRSAGVYAKRLALVCIGLVACAGLGNVIDHQVLHARPVHPEAQVVIFDIAGTSVRSGRNLFAEMPGWPAPPGLPPVESCYTPQLWDNFAPWGPCRNYVFASRTALARAGTGRFVGWWAGTLAAHPFAYAGHRIAYMRENWRAGALGPPRIAVFGLQYALNGRGQEAALAAAAHGRIGPGYFQVWEEGRMPSPLPVLTLVMLFFPWLTLLAFLAALALLAAAWRGRRAGRAPERVAMAAAALGVGNVAMMLVFGAAASPRYFLPLVLGAWIVVAAALRDTGREKSGDDRPLAPPPEQQPLHISTG